MHSECAQRNQQVKSEWKTSGPAQGSLQWHLHPPHPHPLALISDASTAHFFSKPNLENREPSFFFQDPHCSGLQAHSQSSELKWCVDGAHAPPCCKSPTHCYPTWGKTPNGYLYPLRVAMQTWPVTVAKLPALHVAMAQGNTFTQDTALLWCLGLARFQWWITSPK